MMRTLADRHPLRRAIGHGLLFFLLSCVLPAAAAIARPVASGDRLLANQLATGTGTLYAATGFFIRHDGMVLTVAHGVAACHQILVGSDRVAAVPASIVFSDTKPDIAVLQAIGAVPPATLALAGLSQPDAVLEAFGFPPQGLLTAPNSTRPLLLNPHVLPGEPADPNHVLWLQNRTITHGWSGGPVLDTELNRVIGMTLALAPGDQHRRVFDQPQTDVALAVGSGTIGTVLQRAGITVDPPDGVPSDAVVRVFCWR